MSRQRKKTWNEKVTEVRKCYYRSIENPHFPKYFYRNLFFLSPKIEDYFKNTDWEHQEKALMLGLSHLFHYFDEQDIFHHKQIVRLANVHSHDNLNIHPHMYYYWIEALVMTCKKVDPQWYEDLQYYLRETIFFPISFMISLYHHHED